MLDEARRIKMDFPACEQRVREAFGDPWRESKYTLVFKLGNGA